MIFIDSISKSYGDKNVLNEVSFHIEKGSITSLIGPNGAGKSTLLMIIAKLMQSSTGQVFLDQQNIADISTTHYARKVATLRQSLDVGLRLTVEELISFGRFPYSHGALTEHDNKVIDESIDFLGLQELRHQYLDEISGGQRQMAFLAMTIAQQTDVLLLDEPLNNLDMKHALQIMQALRHLCDRYGRTIILVIHDINFAANYSDYLVALKKGKLAFSGTVDEVITEQNLNALYELNFTIHKNDRGILCNYFT